MSGVAPGSSFSGGSYQPIHTFGTPYQPPALTHTQHTTFAASTSSSTKRINTNIGTLSQSTPRPTSSAAAQPTPIMHHPANSPPPTLQQSTHMYESRLRSLASNLLSRLTSAGAGAGGGGSGDPALLALQRDADSQPFMLDRITELFNQALHNERESMVQHLTQELAARDGMLQSLRSEYDAIRKTAQLKESLLHERAEILKEELLAQKATEATASNLVGSVVPRLQGEIGQLQNSVQREHQLATSLGEELRKRDSDLETMSHKYDSLADQFLQLQQLVSTLNTRVLDQSSEMELTRAGAKKIREAAEKEVREYRDAKEKAERELAIQAKEFESQRAHHAQSTALHDATISQQAELKERQVQGDIDRLQEELNRMKQDRDEAVASLKQAQVEHESRLSAALHSHNTAAASHDSKLKDEIANLTKRHEDALRRLEKQHGDELSWRMSDHEKTRQQLALQLASSEEALKKFHIDRERDVRELGATEKELQLLLSNEREARHRIEGELKSTTASLHSTRSKYESVVAKFQSTLDEDESRFTQRIEAEQARASELKRKWSEDIIRFKEELQRRDTVEKSLNDTNADLQRHASSMADAIAQSKRREEELERKIHEESLKSASSLSVAQRSLADSKEKLDRLQDTLRDKDRMLDRLNLEKESEFKRMGQELEVRLERQKQSHVLERLSQEKDLAQLRTNMEVVKSQHDGQLRELRSKHEEEKSRWHAEHAMELEKRLAAQRAEQPSQADFDAAVRKLVDQHIVELNKTYLAPDAVESIVQNKLEHARFEQERMLHKLKVEHETQVTELKRMSEVRLKQALQEMRSKYENEHAQTLVQVKNGCTAYENELLQERTARREAEERNEAATKALEQAETKKNSFEQQLRDETSARQQVVDQLEQSSRVIDKLKSLLTSERHSHEARLEELSNKSRDELSRQREDSIRDLEHLKSEHASTLQLAHTNHAHAVETLRAKHHTERVELRAAFEGVLQEEVGKVQQSLHEQREAASNQQIQLEAELQTMRQAFSTKVEQHDQHVRRLEETHANVMKDYQTQITASAESTNLATSQARQREEELRKECFEEVQRVRQECQNEMQQSLQQAEKRQTELESQLEARMVQHEHQLRHASDAARQSASTKDTLVKDLESRLSRAHSEVDSKTRQLRVVWEVQRRMKKEMKELKDQHSAIQVGVRQELMELYATATNSLATMHGTLQDLRSKLFAREQSLRELLAQLHHTEDELRLKTDELVSSRADAAAELDAMRQEHLLASALASTNGQQYRKEDVEELQQRLQQMEQLHAQQMERIRQEQEEEYKQQLEHVEELLRIKAGVMLNPMTTTGGTDGTGTTGGVGNPHDDSRAGVNPTPDDSYARSSFRSEGRTGVGVPSASFRSSVGPGAAGAAIDSSIGSRDVSINPGAWRPSQSTFARHHHQQQQQQQQRQGELSFARSYHRPASAAVGGGNYIESSPTMSAISMAPSSVDSDLLPLSCPSSASHHVARSSQRMPNELEECKLPTDLAGSVQPAASTPASVQEPPGRPLTASDIEEADTSTQPASMAPASLDGDSSARDLLHSLLSKVHDALSANVDGSSPSAGGVGVGSALNSSLLNQSHASIVEDLLETSFGPREYEEIMRASKLHKLSKQIAQNVQPAAGASATQNHDAHADIATVASATAPIQIQQRT